MGLRFLAGGFAGEEPPRQKGALQASGTGAGAGVGPEVSEARVNGRSLHSFTLELNLSNSRTHS
jgi:hypothetical protein